MFIIVLVREEKCVSEKDRGRGSSTKIFTWPSGFQLAEENILRKRMSKNYALF